METIRLFSGFAIATNKELLDAEGRKQLEIDDVSFVEIGRPAPNRLEEENERNIDQRVTVYVKTRVGFLAIGEDRGLDN